LECTPVHHVEAHYKIFYDIDDDDDDDRRTQLQRASVMLTGLKLEFLN